MAKTIADAWTRALSARLGDANYDTFLARMPPKKLCTKKAFRSWYDWPADPDERYDDIGWASLRSRFLFGELRPRVYFVTEKDGYSVDGVISYEDVDDEVYEHAPCVKI